MHYIYSPAGTPNLLNITPSVLERCVIYIGSTEKGIGIGSNFARGMRYLRNKLRCSGKAIKRTCKKTWKIKYGDRKEYGSYVYYYHLIFCDKIVQAIIDELKPLSDIKKKELLGFIPRDGEYLNAVYEHRLSQLRWVDNQDYKEQGEYAHGLLENFKKITD